MQAYELKVKWLGFELRFELGFEDVDGSWKPLDNVAADVSPGVKRYADQTGDPELQRLSRSSVRNHYYEATK